MFRPWLLFLLVGCGRVRFDDHGADGNGSGAADAGVAGCTTAETCNSVDDDCDGKVDESCPCTPYSIALDHPAGGTSLVHAVWTGSILTVYEFANSTLYTLDSAGNQLGSVPTDGYIQHLMWDGVDLVGTLSGASSIDMFRIASDGAATTFATVPTGPNYGYAITHRPSGGYDLAWIDSPMPATLWGLALDPSGTPIGPPTQLATTSGMMKLFGVTTGQPALALHAEPQAYLSAFGGSPIQLATQLGVSGGIAAATSGAAAIVASANQSATIPIAADGTSAGAAVPIDINGLTPSVLAITARGAGYVAVVVGSRNSPTRIEAQRFELDATATPTGAATILHSEVGPAGSVGFSTFGLVADAERTVIAFGYQISSANTVQVVQTCP